MNESSRTVVCVGVDAGGTGSRLLAIDSRNRRWTDRGSAANPRIVGIERASSVLSGMLDRVIEQFPNARVFRVCLGVAGAAAAKMQRALADSVRLDLKNGAGVVLEVTDDARIAYEAAFAGEPGVLIVVGTGSSILVRSNSGSFVRAGGWGFLLGDEGSGYGIGRAGLRAVAASIDAGVPTALTTRAASDLGVKTRDALIEKVYGTDYSLSAFAMAVLEEAARGDDESVAIINREIRKLADRFHALVERRSLDVAGILKVSGGLSRSRSYMIALAGVIKEYFPDWEVSRCDREPVEGALWMAQKMKD